MSEPDVINFFHPQAYLMFAKTNYSLGLQASPKQAKLSPSNTSISVHRCTGKYEPTEVMSRVFNSKDPSTKSMIKKHFFNLPAHKISALVPELRFFKSEGGRMTPFYFPVSALGENVGSLTDPARIGASMVRNFSIEYQGTDPYTAPIYQKASLELYVDNLENIFAKPPEPGYARLADLFTISIANPTHRAEAGASSVSSGDLSRPVEVAATLGYSALDNDIFTREELRDIKESNLSFLMNVFNHTINVNQNGSATINIQYTARINSALKSKLFSAISSPADALAQADLQQLFADDTSKSDDMDKNKKKKLSLERKRKARISKSNECRQIMEELQSKKQIYTLLVIPSQYASYTMLGTLANEKENAKKSAATGEQKTTTDKKLESGKGSKSKNNQAPPTNFFDNSAELTEYIKNIDFSVRNVNYVFFGDVLQSFITKVYNNIQNAIKAIRNSETAEGKAELKRQNLSGFLEKSKNDKLKIKRVLEEARDKMRSYKIILSDVEIKYFTATAGGDATNTKRINIADIPISLSVYQKFMYSSVINTSRNSFVIPQFLELCLRKGGLLDMALSQFSETGIAPSVITAAPQITSTLFTGKRLSSKNAKKASLTPEDIPSALRPDAPFSPDEECDYFVVHQSPTKDLSKDGRGSPKDDARKGIYHFEVGKNRGLLKNLSFSRIDVPFMQEQLMLNQVGMYDELKMIYNVSIDMVGNNLFIPGSKIFVDPSTIGMGSPLDKKSASFRLGLGGYYIVHGITTSVNNGVMSTSLTCTHEAHADEREQPSLALTDPVPKSGEIEDQEQSTSPDPVPSYVTNQKIIVPDYYGMYYRALLELRDTQDMLVLDKEMAKSLAKDYQMDPEERPSSVKGVRSRQIGSGGTVIYHLVNGRSIKMKNTVNTDAVTLVTTSKTVPK